MSGALPPHLRPVAAASLAGLSVAAIVLILGQCRRSQAKELSREELLEVLEELARRFFAVCHGFAGVSRSLHGKLAAGKLPQMTKEQLQEQLVAQFRLYEKLRAAQDEAFVKFGVSEEVVQALQRQYGDDPEVAAFEPGFKAALRDAMEGEMPVLPGLKIPEALTEDKVLEIQTEAQALEVRKVVEKISGSRVPVEELEGVLVTANRDAWEETLSKHGDCLGGGGDEVYHSTVAVYLKEHPSFAARRQKLEEKHHKKVVGLFKPEQSQAPSAATA